MLFKLYATRDFGETWFRLGQSVTNYTWTAATEMASQLISDTSVVYTYVCAYNIPLSHLYLDNDCV